MVDILIKMNNLDLLILNFLYMLNKVSNKNEYGFIKYYILFLGLK